MQPHILHEQTVKLFRYTSPCRQTFFKFRDILLLRNKQFYIGGTRVKVGRNEDVAVIDL